MHFPTPCKPAVDHRWLYLVSALMWGIVGIMLTRLAYIWLTPEATTTTILLGLVGIVSGTIIYRFGFSRLADKNMRRIDGLDEPACLLAFQSIKSYLTIVFMMGLGITLRHSPIPKPALAVLYAGIGIGLFLSSLRYYRHML